MASAQDDRAIAGAKRRAGAAMSTTRTPSDGLGRIAPKKMARLADLVIAVAALRAVGGYQPARTAKTPARQRQIVRHVGFVPIVTVGVGSALLGAATAVGSSSGAIKQLQAEKAEIEASYAELADSLEQERELVAKKFAEERSALEAVMEGQKLNMTASIELLEDRIFELDAAFEAATGRIREEYDADLRQRLEELQARLKRDYTTSLELQRSRLERDAAMALADAEAGWERRENESATALAEAEAQLRENAGALAEAAENAKQRELDDRAAFQMEKLSLLNEQRASLMAATEEKTELQLRNAELSQALRDVQAELDRIAKLAELDARRGWAQRLFAPRRAPAVPANGTREEGRETQDATSGAQ